MWGARLAARISRAMVESGAEGGQRGTVAVVLVDDVPELRELVRYGLEGDDEIHVVGEAGSGREAVTAVEALSPAAIVLDLSMPDVDGFQAIFELRSRHPRLAIVVLSGFTPERIRERVIERGADAYIEKGTPISELAEALKRAVAERRTEPEHSPA
jgi:DNA-binding NarL/FixJ family response regulator